MTFKPDGNSNKTVPELADFVVVVVKMPLIICYCLCIEERIFSRRQTYRGKVKDIDCNDDVNNYKILKIKILFKIT